MPTPSPSEGKLKHLEFLQAVIARQSTASFALKGWSITVVGALFAFALDRTDYRIALIGIVASMGFWFLDSFYLRQERLFRCLYAVVADNTTMPMLSMNTNIFKKQGVHKTTWKRVILSVTLVALYLPMFLLGWILVGYLVSQ